jgi:hypothetical protein
MHGERTCTDLYQSIHLGLLFIPTFLLIYIHVLIMFLSSFYNYNKRRHELPKLLAKIQVKEALK